MESQLLIDPSTLKRMGTLTQTLRVNQTVWCLLSKDQVECFLLVFCIRAFFYNSPSNGLFPPVDSDSDSDSKPYRYIVLCTAFSTDSDSDSDHVWIVSQMVTVFILGMDPRPRDRSPSLFHTF